MKPRRAVYTGTKFLKRLQIDDPLAIEVTDPISNGDESFDLFIALATENGWSTDWSTFVQFCESHDLPVLDQTSFNNKFTALAVAQAKAKWQPPQHRRAATRRSAVRT